MYEVSFFETSSVLDETGSFMNVSIGGADGMLTPDSPVEETSGSSKPVKPDLTPAVYLYHEITNKWGLVQSKRSPSFARDPMIFCS